jgi:type II secretory pathway pseudopilin PulG
MGLGFSTARLRRRPAPPPGRPAEAGYNMVMLIMAITVVSIMVAAVLPLMSTEIRREKEEELIFRGFQYAEGIRAFHLKFGRYPNKLEELLEVQPRHLRQLWKDPMTKDGKWGLIFQNQGTPLQAQIPGNPNNPNNPNDPNNPNPNPNQINQSANNPYDTNSANGASQTSDPNNPDGSPGLNTPQKGDVVALGPIVGVYSKSAKKSFLVFFGQNHYNEWRFTEDLLRNGSQRASMPGAPGVGNPGMTVLPNYSVRWLGRPMQFVDQAMPQNGTMPGSSVAGGATQTAPTSSSKNPS